MSAEKILKNNFTRQIVDVEMIGHIFSPKPITIDYTKYEWCLRKQRIWSPNFFCGMGGIPAKDPYKYDDKLLIKWHSANERFETVHRCVGAGPFPRLISDIIMGVRVLYYFIFCCFMACDRAENVSSSEKVFSTFHCNVMRSAWTISDFFISLLFAARILFGKGETLD